MDSKRPSGQEADERVWDEFCEGLKRTGGAVLAAAPDDALDRAEGLRYVARLARGFLRDVVADAPPPRVPFVPGEWLKIGLDNPDYAYFGTKLEPGQRYVLRGSLGDAARIGFGAYSGGLGTPTGLVCDAYLDSENVALDRSGRFEVPIGPDEEQRPHLRTGPATNQFNARITLLRRATDRLPDSKSCGGVRPAAAAARSSRLLPGSRARRPGSRGNGRPVPRLDEGLRIPSPRNPRDRPRALGVGPGRSAHPLFLQLLGDR